jgi:phage tail sheath protein FI
MAVTVSYPGIYVQELPSSSHSITAAPTNIAVFIGYTHPLKTPAANFGIPVQIFGFNDYQRQFGGFVRSAAFAAAGDAFAFSSSGGDSTKSFGDMAEAVNQFFINGGTQAYVVATHNEGLDLSGAADTASKTIGGVKFTPKEITDQVFGMTVTVRPINPSSPPALTDLADIIISYGPSTGPGTITETFRQVSMQEKQADGTPNPDYVLKRLDSSRLVSVSLNPPSPVAPFPATASPATMGNVLDQGTAIFYASDFTTVMAQDGGLDKLAIFNLMVIPGVVNTLVLSTALAFCEKKRAFLIMDPPITASADGTDTAFPNRIQDVMAGSVSAIPAPPAGPNAAIYFPYLKSPDPLTGNANNAVTNHVNEIPPAATVAGLFAQTDVDRGVWKAPAGFQTITLATTGVVDRGKMTDMRQGVLNPIGVNCLRDFPNVGTVVFGARTLVTVTDEQWRYVPVRRMALFIEQSLVGSLGWAVFEPNADPLWSAIRMSVNAFMLGLFRQGAFKGTTPSQAFSVQCDAQTTTQNDIDQGIVNIVVGFAPLKPAEFVVISIAQLAGQSQSG